MRLKRGRRFPPNSILKIFTTRVTLWRPLLLNEVRAISIPTSIANALYLEARALVRRKLLYGLESGRLHNVVGQFADEGCGVIRVDVCIV